MKTKVCSKCGIRKKLSAFHKNTRGGKKGYRADCRVCHTKTAIEWAKKNKSKVRGYSKTYYHRKLQKNENKKNENKKNKEDKP